MSLVVVMVFALGVLALTGIGPLRRLRVQALQKLRRMTLAYGVVAVPMNLLTPSVKERPSGTGAVHDPEPRHPGARADPPTCHTVLGPTARHSDSVKRVVV